MRILSLTVALCLLGQAAFAQATSSQDPCEAIVFACKAAGYVQGGSGSGKGLWEDCVGPIMQGKRPANVAPALPPIAPARVSACHQARPQFGLPAESGAPAPPKPEIVFSVSADQRLDYPRAEYPGLADEHQTFLPVWHPDRKAEEVPAYRLIAAMVHKVNGKEYGWTFLLQTEDLLSFRLVPGAGDAAQGGAIFWPPHPLLMTGPPGCNYPGVTHFDEQYSAPGSVLQDPTQPPGNMIMIYESEIHCPWSKGGGGVGWVSVGVAHSRWVDDHRGHRYVVWPKPVAARGYERNWLDYGNGRYAGLTIPGVPQTTGQFERFNGDSLPSAFVDDVRPSEEEYLYALYSFTGTPTKITDGKVHIARAKLGERKGDRAPAKLRFKKWYQGGWNAPGIQTTLADIQDDGIDPPGCDSPGPSLDGNAQLMYNEALGRYMLTYVCRRLDCSTKPCARVSLSWYYRTTEDLSTQKWSAPQLIENSTYPVIKTGTDKNGNVHFSEDGGYPTFMTPGCPPGHIGLTGYVFFLKGDPLGERDYTRRRFEIKPGDTPVRKACGSGTARGDAR